MVMVLVWGRPVGSSRLPVQPGFLELSCADLAREDGLG